METENAIAAGIGILVAAVAVNEVAADMKRIQNGILRLDYVAVKPGLESIRGTITRKGIPVPGAAVDLSQSWLNKRGGLVGDFPRASTSTQTAGAYVIWLSTVAKSPLPTTTELPKWCWVLRAYKAAYGNNYTVINLPPCYDVLVNMELI